MTSLHQSGASCWKGPKVQPLPVATGAVGEATEGKLVRIRGTITQPIINDLPFGFIIFINDGTGEVHAFVCALPRLPRSLLVAARAFRPAHFFPVRFCEPRPLLCTLTCCGLLIVTGTTARHSRISTTVDT